jgi:ketosteroid isomerase-like protein
MYRELTARRFRAIVPNRGDDTMMTVESLDAFFRDGWNRHDLNVLMTFMTDDCVFEGATGTAAWGTRYAGRERVREAFAGVFAAVPDAMFHEVRHVVAGDRGVSEWVFRGDHDRRPHPRGQRVRPVRVPRGKDRRQELAPEAPHGVSGCGRSSGPR